jgi:hypothetical protein
MNSRKKVAWAKHRKKAKKLKLRRKLASSSGHAPTKSRSAS